MLFNSLGFLIFFPIVLGIYHLIPARVRYLWLLAASYFFYMCWSARYVLLLLLSTVVTYGCGLVLERIGSAASNPAAKRRGKKLCLGGFISETHALVDSVQF